MAVLILLKLPEAADAALSSHTAFSRDFSFLYKVAPTTVRKSSRSQTPPPPALWFVCAFFPIQDFTSFSKQMSANLHLFPFPGMSILLNICQTVADINMILQFHDFLNLTSWHYVEKLDAALSSTKLLQQQRCDLYVLLLKVLFSWNRNIHF